jgi:polar amino acid transport system substrate-binding protein
VPIDQLQKEKGNIVNALRHKAVLLSATLGAIGIALALSNSPSSAADEALLGKLEKDTAIYNSVPQKFRDAGVINAATEADYPPFDFLDEQNELTGADLDISAALGKIMGVPIKNHKTEFSAIIPGIQAGRFDIGVSSIGDYLKREETMDFVDYYHGGNSFLVRTGTFNPKTAAEVCGTAMGALKGTSSEKQANKNSANCVSSGKPAIQVSAFPTQNDAVLALTSGRVLSVSGDAATNGYSAKQVGPTLQNIVTTIYGGEWIAGVAIPKNSALYQPIYDAMAVLIKSGVYAEILKKWGLEDGALSAPGKNQGIAD